MCLLQGCACSLRIVAISQEVAEVQVNVRRRLRYTKRLAAAAQAALLGMQGPCVAMVCAIPV